MHIYWHRTRLPTCNIYIIMMYRALLVGKCMFLQDSQSTTGKTEPGIHTVVDGEITGLCSSTSSSIQGIPSIPSISSSSFIPLIYTQIQPWISTASILGLTITTSFYQLQTKHYPYFNNYNFVFNKQLKISILYIYGTLEIIEWYHQFLSHS